MDALMEISVSGTFSWRDPPGSAERRHRHAIEQAPRRWWRRCTKSTQASKIFNLCSCIPLDTVHLALIHFLMHSWLRLEDRSAPYRRTATGCRVGRGEETRPGLEPQDGRMFREGGRLVDAVREEDALREVDATGGSGGVSSDCT